MRTSSWVGLEIAHRLKATWPSTLAFGLVLMLLLAASGGTTPRETALLTEMHLRSGWTAVLAAGTVLPMALDPRAARAATLARSVGFGPTAHSVLSFLSALCVSFVQCISLLLILMISGAAHSISIATGSFPALVFQFYLYLLPLISLSVALQRLRWNLADRALLLAILALFTHRILSPHAFPLDLLALHPAGDSWLQSSRSLAESIVLSVAGTAGGLLLAAAVDPLKHHG